MRIEKLTTVSSLYTEKVLESGMFSVVNTSSSGSGSTSTSWQVANIVTGTTTFASLPEPPIIRAMWSIDGNLWYDSATRIPFVYNITQGGSTLATLAGMTHGCSIGVDNNTIYARTGNGQHGNVTINNSGQYTWSGVSKTFNIKYAIIEPSSSVNVTSKRNSLVNKLIANGNVNFSGTVNTVREFTQTIPIDYVPNFFSIEFIVRNHNVSDIPNNMWTHSNGVGYTISGQDPNRIFVYGGVRNDGNLIISAFASSGSTVATTTNFTVDYRLIDLGASQSIGTTNLNNIALVNKYNSPSRSGASVDTATAPSTSSGMSSSLTKHFNGVTFIDHYYDAADNGIFWRNSSAITQQDLSSTFGGVLYPEALVYNDANSVNAYWTAGYSGGPVNPSGRRLRYIEYGDYSDVT